MATAFRYCRYILALSHSTREVLLAFRGTLSLADGATDLLCEVRLPEYELVASSVLLLVAQLGATVGAAAYCDSVH